MKVILNADGVLNIIPENGTEVYALKHWKQSACFPQIYSVELVHQIRNT